MMPAVLLLSVFQGSYISEWTVPEGGQHTATVCVVSEDKGQKLPDPQAGLMALCPVPLILT